jgi:hypothetical protein
MNGHTNDSGRLDGDDPTSIIQCPDCDKLVPLSNMDLHHLRACKGRARPDATNSSPSDTRQRRAGEPNTTTTNTVTTTTSIASDATTPTGRTPFGTWREPKSNNGGGDDDDTDLEEENPSDDSPPHKKPRAIDVDRACSDSTEDTLPASSDCRRRHPRLPRTFASDGSNFDDEVAEVVDVVNLCDVEYPPARLGAAAAPAPTAAPAAVAASAAASALDLTRDSEDGSAAGDAAPPDHWACPQCTLWNPNIQPTCDACAYRSPNHLRPPDATRTERLVGGARPPILGGLQSSPLSLVGGGAVLGGIMGATGNWIHGRDPLQGAIEGGTMGGIGGAFLHEALRAAPAAPARRATATQVVTTIGGDGGALAASDVASARSSVAMGMASYPSMDRGGGGRNTSRAQPRSSFRVVRTVNPIAGTEVVVVDEGSTTTRITRRRNTSSVDPTYDPVLYSLRESASNGGATRRNTANVDPMYDPILSYLLHSQMLQHRGPGGGGGGHPNVDTMDYEQLLTAFGDGTENLGAEEGEILRLPTRVIQDPIRELPDGARQCLICMEDFERGETRIILPCLHGFHEGCAHKWLLSNGCCPVCKHRL